MSTGPETPASSPSSDVPDSSAPDPDSESAASTSSGAGAEWPPYGSWRRAPLLPLVVIAAVVIVLVAGISSAAGVLVGIVATKNADSHHSRYEDRRGGPFGPGRDRPRQHHRAPRAVPTTEAPPAPATPSNPAAPTTPAAPPTAIPTTS
jgi:hypothetical protein